VEPISEFRKLDELIGWLVFGEIGDAKFEHTHVKAVATGVMLPSSKLMAYTSDPEARLRIEKHIEANGGKVTYRKTTNALAPVACVLQAGTMKFWLDAKVSSTSKEMALCIAVIAATHLVLTRQGVRHVSLPWLLNLRTTPPVLA